MEPSTATATPEAKASRTDLIAAAAALAEDRGGPGGFVRDLFGRVAPEDLTAYPPRTLADLALAARAHLAAARPARTISAVRAFRHRGGAGRAPARPHGAGGGQRQPAVPARFDAGRARRPRLSSPASSPTRSSGSSATRTAPWCGSSARPPRRMRGPMPRAWPARASSTSISTASTTRRPGDAGRQPRPDLRRRRRDGGRPYGHDRAAGRGGGRLGRGAGTAGARGGVGGPRLPRLAARRAFRAAGPARIPRPGTGRPCRRAGQRARPPARSRHRGPARAAATPWWR